MKHKTIIQPLDANAAKQLVGSRAGELIDIREPDEIAREYIPGAHFESLSKFDAQRFTNKQNLIGIFHCNSGRRTIEAGAQLAQTGYREVYYLDGGIQAWKAAGLETRLNKSAPISVMRQVQILVGSFVMLGILLGYLATLWLYLFAAAMGAGMVFAGIIGNCALANIISKLPFNRRSLTAGVPTST